MPSARHRSHRGGPRGSRGRAAQRPAAAHRPFLTPRVPRSDAGGTRPPGWQTPPHTEAGSPGWTPAGEEAVAMARLRTYRFHHGDAWAADYARGRQSGGGFLTRGLQLRTAAALEAISTRFTGCQPFSLLDIGTAGSEMLGALCAAFPEATAVGLDRARGLLAGTGVRAPLVQANATRLPFVGGAFDVCLFAAVLKHITAADRALAEAARVTRPGGYAVAIEPSTSAMLVGRLLGYYPRGSIMHYFTARQLCRRMARAGFRNVEVSMRPLSARCRWLCRLARWSRAISLAPGWIVVVCQRE